MTISTALYMKLILFSIFWHKRVDKSPPIPYLHSDFLVLSKVGAYTLIIITWFLSLKFVVNIHILSEIGLKLTFVFVFTIIPTPFLDFSLFTEQYNYKTSPVVDVNV